ncbi:hypothetical protein [Salibacterium sp. K-3]
MTTKMAWLLNLIASAICLYVIAQFTVSPDQISGNGNIGLLFIMVGTPFFILGLYYTFKMGEKLLPVLVRRHKGKMALLLAVIAFIGLSLGWGLHAAGLMEALADGLENEMSRIYRFGQLNQYTNMLYFNGYSFLLLHLISAAGGCLYRKRKIRNKGESL